MNGRRREKLRRASEYLGFARQLIEKAQDEEQEMLDNLPENLSESDRAWKMENAVDSLDGATSSIDDALEYVTEAMA
jgi:hypothetical protein